MKPNSVAPPDNREILRSLIHDLSNLHDQASEALATTVATSLSCSRHPSHCWNVPAPNFAQTGLLENVLPPHRTVGQTAADTAAQTGHLTNQGPTAHFETADFLCPF